MLREKNALHLVMKSDDTIIGYAAVTFYRRNDFDVRGITGNMTELIIDEAYRGKGYGTRFLREIERRAQKRHCIELEFTSTFKRVDAHRFYESHGYHKSAFFFWKEL